MKDNNSRELLEMASAPNICGTVFNCMEIGLPRSTLTRGLPEFFLRPPSSTHQVLASPSKWAVSFKKIRRCAMGSLRVSSLFI